jgi:hypothetical protein
MLTQKEKEFVLQVWKKVMPGGNTIAEVKANIATIEAIGAKLAALPVEEPVEVEAAVSPEVMKAVEGKPRKRH